MWKVNYKLLNFKSQLTRFKSITNRNKKYDLLTDEEKRREIAWDILQLIEHKVVRASNGNYWGRSKILDTIAVSRIKAEKVQEILNTELPKKTCHVCARGGIMLSRIRLGGGIHGNTCFMSSGWDNIELPFTMSVLENMEREYENTLFKHPFKHNTINKLKNIMCNIIANGDFDITDKTRYLVR